MKNSIPRQYLKCKKQVILQRRKEYLNGYFIS